MVGGASGRENCQKPGADVPLAGPRDRYTIASTVTTVYALTFIPRVNTVNLFLNGLALDEGADYTVDYTAPSITLTAAASRAVRLARASE